MTADEIKSAYAETLDETVILRRYTGQGPTASKPRFEVSARGKSWGYTAKELVGAIQQGDRRVLVLIDDLIEKGFSLPVVGSDKVIVDGRELAIINPGLRKAPDGTPIVCDLHTRG